MLSQPLVEGEESSVSIVDCAIIDPSFAARAELDRLYKMILRRRCRISYGVPNGFVELEGLVSGRATCRKILAAYQTSNRCRLGRLCVSTGERCHIFVSLPQLGKTCGQVLLT